jgi:ketol-acid reductoisomerase
MLSGTFSSSNSVENTVLIAVNKSIRPPIEETGAWLRASMTAMKKSDKL